MHLSGIRTIELVEHLKVNRYSYFDVSLLLNYNLRATHTISYRKNLIWDEGIDNLTIKWQLVEFLEHYKNANWIIN